MASTISPKSVSTWEAARLSGYTDQTIRNLIHKGKLTARRLPDGRYRLDLAQIEKLAEARKALAQVMAS